MMTSRQLKARIGVRPKDTKIYHWEKLGMPVDRSSGEARYDEVAVIAWLQERGYVGADGKYSARPPAAGGEAAPAAEDAGMVQVRLVVPEKKPAEDLYRGAGMYRAGQDVAPAAAGSRTDVELVRETLRALLEHYGCVEGSDPDVLAGLSLGGMADEIAADVAGGGDEDGKREWRERVEPGLGQLIGWCEGVARAPGAGGAAVAAADERLRQLVWELGLERLEDGLQALAARAAEPRAAGRG
jgi:hypothetical protein